MSDVFAALGIGVLILSPIVILTIAISGVAIKRGEENLHAEDN